MDLKSELMIVIPPNILFPSNMNKEHSLKDKLKNLDPFTIKKELNPEIMASNDGKLIKSWKPQFYKKKILIDIDKNYLKFNI